MCVCADLCVLVCVCLRAIHVNLLILLVTYYDHVSCCLPSLEIGSYHPYKGRGFDTQIDWLSFLLKIAGYNNGAISV